MSAIADPALDSAVLGALRTVIDPELGLDLVELGLIRTRRLEPDGSIALEMVLTTPFCPYGPALVEETRAALEAATGRSATVRVLAERWEPPEELGALLGLVW